MATGIGIHALAAHVKPAVAPELAEAAKTLDCDEVRGKYIPTGKNAMVKDLYQRFNFRHDPQSDEWVVKIAEAPQTPEHIEVALHLRDGGDRPEPRNQLTKKDSSAAA